MQLGFSKKCLNKINIGDIVVYQIWEETSSFEIVSRAHKLLIGGTNKSTDYTHQMNKEKAAFWYHIGDTNFLYYKTFSEPNSHLIKKIFKK